MDLSVARGKIVYGRYCTICHGESGEGDGFNAYNIKATYGLTPTAFADSSAFSSVPADSALAAIRNGGPAVGKSPAMPPWGRTLTPGDLIDVWDYVRSLAHAARGN
jgi:cytochrome c oxidase cbb3-type subunit 3